MTLTMERYRKRCPKCGSPETRLAYCPPLPVAFLFDALERLERHPDDDCTPGEDEHFHRHCEKCGYRWKTSDVLGSA